MDHKYIKECINEFSKLRKNKPKNESTLLEAALFIEDVFDLTLSDDEICGKNLGSSKAMKHFVLKKLK